MRPTERTSSVFARQIASAVGAVTLHPPDRFAWMGLLSPAPFDGARVADADVIRGRLVAALGDRLYSDFYCAGNPRPASESEGALMGGSDDRFVDALSAANCGAGPWESEWRLLERRDGRWLAERDGLSVMVPADRVRGDRDDEHARAEVRLPKELRRMSPGYYFVLGDAPLDPRTEPLVRIYWHLTASVAVPFVAAITRVFNRAGCPFRLKVLDARSAYRRCDAAILYLYKHDFARARSCLRTLQAEFDGLLASPVPALTKRLAPGLAIAEDPGAGESFGEHRCSLLADGIVRADELGATELVARTAVVRARLLEAAVDPDAPFLAPGSADVYELDGA